MTPGKRASLSFMMFLQFFIWGSWFVTLGTYLTHAFAATGAQVGLAFATQSWGAIIAPFVVGWIADRYVNAERLLAALHALGAVILYALYSAREFDHFYGLLLTYMIVYMPTLALVNSVAFRQMSEPSRSFSGIRVWGTIGWIAAGLAISLGFSWDSEAGVLAGALRFTFLMAAVASVLLSLFALSLPKTPPQFGAQARGRVLDLLGLQTLGLLKNRNMLTFFVASILICIPLAFYYQNANQFLIEIHVANATGKQSIGQMSEVLFMLLLPLFLRRFGMKATLMVGMLAWAARYVAFAYGNSGELVALLIAGIALHGVCYDFFFVSGQIFIDSRAGKDSKSAAQGLITLATYGVGMLIGFWVAGRVSDLYTIDGAHDWKAIWLLPAGFAALVFVIFGVSFRNEKIRYGAA
jgi:nucleoside transporter